MSEYSNVEKILHQLMLGANFVGEVLFDLEKIFYHKKASNYSQDDHVFVCGLARAGTTILMREIYQSEKFSSLIYKDMPLVMGA